MKAGIWSSGCLLIWLCGAGAAMAAQAAAPRDVEVRASLDRTAVWVADPLTYTITIVCRKGVDILADDLSKDKLRVEGFEIVGSDSDRAIDRNETTTYTFRYALTTYRVDVPELKVAPLTVRYYVKRPGQRLEDAASAGEAQVPAASVALRSALPDGQESYELRDGRGPRPRRLRYAWLQPIGAGLVLLSIVPAVVGMVAVVRRRRPRERSRSAREIRQDERTSLEALEALDLSSPAARREAFSRLNTLVRDHVTYAAGIAAAGLTPAEIEAVAARRGARVPVELVAGVLNACDRARYAPAESLPSADECKEAIQEVARLL